MTFLRAFFRTYPKELVAAAIFLVGVAFVAISGRWMDNLETLLLALLGFVFFAFSYEAVPFFGERVWSMSDWRFYPPVVVRWIGAVMLVANTWVLIFP